MSDQAATAIAVAVAFAVDLAIRIVALIVVPRDRRPSAAMAWLLAIFLIPYVGILLYLVIGSSKLPISRRKKQRAINELIASASGDARSPTDRDDWPPWLAAVATMNQSVGSMPIVEGNDAHLISDYQASIDSMAADIREARWFVHVEFYIVSFDSTTAEFFSSLEDAVSRGVSVKVLLDHISSIRVSNHKATLAELDRIGVEWRFMLPVQPFKGKYQRPDLRNHRKLVVVDGRVGYMGSQNLIDRGYNSTKNLKRGLQWQELMARVTGPVVTGMNVVFLGDWFSETGEKLDHENVPLASLVRIESPGSLDCQVVPSGPGFDGENNLRLFLALLHSAQRRVIITSPYFVPDEAMMYAITSAVQRGLDVQLFVSEIGDQGLVFHSQRSYYMELLKGGVTIWMYPPPFILHAKHVSIDDDVAVIGSSNMDIRSFALNMEVSMLVHGRGFVDEMRVVEAYYRSASRELTLADWEKEPRKSAFLDGLARLTSSLE